MNRRDFLRQMLCAAGVAAAPKFIFDMGANLYKPVGLEYASAVFDYGKAAAMTVSFEFKGELFRHGVLLEREIGLPSCRVTEGEKALLRPYLEDWAQTKYNKLITQS